MFFSFFSKLYIWLLSSSCTHVFNCTRITNYSICIICMLRIHWGREGGWGVKNPKHFTSQKLKYAIERYNLLMIGPWNWNADSAPGNSDKWSLCKCSCMSVCCYSSQHRHIPTSLYSPAQTDSLSTVPAFTAHITPFSATSN
jgi:hypothetical protein